MLSKAVSPWKGKSHELGISDPQVRPRTGRVTTIFTKLSTSPLQRAYKQELWRLFEQSWELVLLRMLVLPISSLSLCQENQDGTGYPSPIPPDLRYLSNPAVPHLSKPTQVAQNPRSPPSWPWEQLNSGSIAEIFEWSYSLTQHSPLLSMNLWCKFKTEGGLPPISLIN